MALSVKVWVKITLENCRGDLSFGKQNREDYLLGEAVGTKILLSDFVLPVLCFISFLKLFTIVKCTIVVFSLTLFKKTTNP